MSSSEPLLRVEGLAAAWGTTPVLRDLRFDVHDSELLVLLGPNGAGKSTLLRCLAGLETPTAGRIWLDGVDLLGTPAHRRGIVMMFQDAALFANRTVYENIAYAPLLQRRARSEVVEEVGRQVELLGLEGLVHREPDQLSGGERQRVALARTLAARPRLVLLDEPFASIDPELKADLRADFRRALRLTRTAALHVTHDRPEGLFLADQVALLFDGRLERIGVPGEVFRQPLTERAARFLGYNVFPGPGESFAVDPHDLRLDPESSGGVALTVVAAGTTGGERLLVLRTAEGDRVECRGTDEALPWVAGDRVGARWERAVPVVPSPRSPPKEALNGRGLDGP